MGKAISLHKRMSLDGPSIYYTESYRIMMEAHIPFFLTNGRSTRVVVDAATAYQYEHDFSALLAVYSLPRYLHWFIMRLNGLTSPLDYHADMLEILVPDLEIVERLRTNHTTQSKTV